MKQLDVFATVLVVVGALNWGLVGLARFDLVAARADLPLSAGDAAADLPVPHELMLRNHV